MALAAVGFALAFPSPALWWLAPVSVGAFAFAAVGARSLWHLLPAVALCWAGAWSWLQWWILEVSTAGMPALVVYLVGWSVAHALVLRRIDGAFEWPVALSLPLTWIGLETLRGVVLFDGYPWYLIGHPLAEVPLVIQSADLLGVPLVGWLVAALGGAGCDTLLRRRGGRSSGRRASQVAAAATIALLVANAIYGLIRLDETDALGVDAPDGPLVLAMQTNVPQSNKIGWAPSQQVRDFENFRRLTLQAFSAELDRGRVPDVVAWPETMVPGFGLEPATIQVLVEGNWFPGDAFASGLLDLAEALQRSMIVGSPSFEGFRAEAARFVWNRHHNSVYVLSPDGARQRYDKVFLTPFGETMPYISAFPWLERRLLDIGARGMRFDQSPGRVVAPMRISSPRGRWSVATPICFEDTVSWLCRKMAFVRSSEGDAEDVPASVLGHARWGWRKRSDLFINLSNDGWFGDNDAGRMQHAQIARFRCVENRLPMVRSVNTGLSLVIDSAGRLRGAAVGEGYGDAREEGALAADVVLDPRIPVYAALGDLLGWTSLLATAGALGVALLRGRRKTSEKSVASDPCA